MNIALPESMKQFVLAQVSAGGYSTASEYVRELIRADQKAKAQQRLEQLLLEGLDSGPATPMTKRDWEALRMQIASARKKPRK
jgi:antitoxin ParD1/3/4